MNQLASNPDPDQILIVEDDEDLATWTREYLESKGFLVMATAYGKDAIDLAKEHNPALILLDGMLPDIDGIDVCREVRHFYQNPIIMLTARDEEIDEVLGLEVGADDYITKPVRARALLARIRGHLRRSQTTSDMPESTETDTPVIKLSELVIDKQNRTVELKGNKISVTSHEFDLIWYLASNAGEVVSRDELVSHLRGFDYDGFDRSIDLRISRIRKKLGDDPSDPYLIKTVWGKGYLFAKENW